MAGLRRGTRESRWVVRPNAVPRRRDSRCQPPPCQRHSFLPRTSCRVLPCRYSECSAGVRHARRSLGEGGPPAAFDLLLCRCHPDRGAPQPTRDLLLLLNLPLPALAVAFAVAVAVDFRTAASCRRLAFAVAPSLSSRTQPQMGEGSAVALGIGTRPPIRRTVSKLHSPDFDWVNRCCRWF